MITKPVPKLKTKLPVKPATIQPLNAEVATIKANGNWVATCSIWTHPAPAEDRMVVSEIGEQ